MNAAMKIRASIATPVIICQGATKVNRSDISASVPWLASP